MKQVQYYSVRNFRGNKPLMVLSSITFGKLYNNIQNSQLYSPFTLYYHWQPLDATCDNLTLKQHVLNITPQQNCPIFYICEDSEEENSDPKTQQLRNNLREQLSMQQNIIKKHQRGSNGHLIFEGRETALLSSSIMFATHSSEYANQMGDAMHFQLIEKLTSCRIEDEQPEPKPSLVRRILVSVGLLKPKISNSAMKELISSLKDSSKSQNSSINVYSDFDPKFVTYLQEVYLLFMIKGAGKLHYVKYNSMEFGVIKRPILSNSRIAILGDFGTGLADSLELLCNVVMRNQADVILHLGDVYYAGTPEEYERGIIAPLKKLRLEAKREILFYSIPGNHDYYSWGLPYLCFIKQINQDFFKQQDASYFCLETQDKSWQFLGMDTAYFDSNPLSQVSAFDSGPHLRSRELEWHRHKLATFRGSTVLLSHHQLISIHDRICGSLSKYRAFSCLNPMLQSQLFSEAPFVSAWFWGHEHSFMLFKDKILGHPKLRLLGNSSFHVFEEKQNPYQRKVQFPYIPFIVSDAEYFQKYLPVNPQKERQMFYNLTYAIIDTSHKLEMNNLNIEYYCSPCYSEGDSKQKHFQRYLLYKELLLSRAAIEKGLEPIKPNIKFYLKCQQGLLLDYDQNCSLKANLQGKPFFFLAQKPQILDDTQVHIFAEDMHLTGNKLTKEKPELMEWSIRNIYKPSGKSEQLRFCYSFEIQHVSTGKKLAWQKGALSLANHAWKWMALKESFIIENTQ